MNCGNANLMSNEECQISIKYGKQKSISNRPIIVSYAKHFDGRMHNNIQHSCDCLSQQNCWDSVQQLNKMEQGHYNKNLICAIFNLLSHVMQLKWSVATMFNSCGNAGDKILVLYYSVYISHTNTIYPQIKPEFKIPNFLVAITILSHFKIKNHEKIIFTSIHCFCQFHLHLFSSLFFFRNKNAALSMVLKDFF